LLLRKTRRNPWISFWVKFQGGLEISSPLKPAIWPEYSLKRTQWKKRSSGMDVRRDGDSNVTDDNAEHFQKIEFPRVETEEGKLKDSK
jgi:hypothetical protein